MNGHRGHSIINLLGLATGMAACLFIFLYIQDEKSFDRFHSDYQRIFRVTTKQTEDGQLRHFAHAYAPLAERLNTGFPGAKQIVRYLPFNAAVKNPQNNTLFQEAGFYFADSLFFEVFDFQLIDGEPSEVLQLPNSIVLTEGAARRYFGDGNPLGQSLIVEGETEMTVTGVVTTVPGQSSLQFDMVANYGSARKVFGYAFDDPRRGGWYYPPVFTFIRFPDLQAMQNMADGMAGFVQKHLPERLHDRYDFQLQPLAEMHFTSLEGDLQPAMKRSLLQVLLGVALLILGIACANYINISMSVLLRRVREIGVRRVLGAVRWQVLQQMVVETMLYLGLALLLAVGVVQINLPAFNNLVGKNLSLLNTSLPFWIGVVGLLLLLGLLVSLLPYLTTLRTQLPEMLKNKIAKATGRQVGSISFKDAFVVFQFASAAALLMVTMVILQQLDFIKNKDIGLATEQVIVVPIRDEAMQANFTAIKQAFRKVPGVEAISAISNFPWESGFYDFPSTLSGGGKAIESNLPTLLVERDFIETMGMEIAAGRSLAETSASDSNMVFLLNQLAGERFGIERPEGWRLKMTGVADGSANEGEVIGIVRDFNLQSLHQAAVPLVMTISPRTYFLDNFVLRLQPGSSDQLKKTITGLSEQWAAAAPDRPFEYFFLDETFDRLYQRESRLGTLFSWFTGLALLIACLGMLALAAMLCEQRVKEIGIRKVLGATTFGLVGLLSRDFLKMVGLSLLIATPLAYYFMDNWLQDFAYRINISWQVFLVASAVAIGVAFLTVSFQSIKAALANPVQSLRSE